MENKIVAFVPMRSGSKEIKDKNIKPLCGLPLCYWALASLEKSNVGKIVVAVDSEEYKNVVKSFAFDKVYLYDRDPKNAQDNSTTESVLLEYFGKGYDDDKEDFILVQVTNPLITKEDVNDLISMYKTDCYQSILTVANLDCRFIWKDGDQGALPINYDYQNRSLRQWGEYEKLYMENGAMYINSVKNLLKSQNRLTIPIGLYVMGSHTIHEIDSEWDWKLIEKILGMV